MSQTGIDEAGCGSSTVPRLFLECGNTLATATNTGIQRVARNLACEAAAAGYRLGMDCWPVILHRGRWLDGRPFLPGGLLAAINRSDCDQPALALSAYTNSRGPLEHLKRLANPEQLWHTLHRELRLLRSARFQPGPGDVVVQIDVWWSTRVRRSLDLARQAGARTGLVIYDLLPITHPRFFPAEFVPIFRRFLDDYLQSQNFVVTISETVADAIRRHCRDLRGRRDGSSPAIGVFPLGASLGRVRATMPPREFENGDETVVLQSQHSVYLAVGTVEPRKNHAYLLDAFDRVWAHCPEVKLCIIGREGWMCGGIVDRIRRHPRFGNQLRWIEHASDATLHLFYRQARALVFASHAEGYGLPIVESLQHGLPVYASDIAVHREVGRDHCMYFDLANPDDLAQLLIQTESTGLYPSVDPGDMAQLIDWNQSTQRFVQLCSELSAR